MGAIHGATGRSWPVALFAGLTVLGTALPLAAFLPWLAVNGLDVPLLVGTLFSNRIGAFFGLDVIVAAVALLAFILIDGHRMGVTLRWMPILATLCIGVSCGLPFYLTLREWQRLRAGSPAA